MDISQGIRHCILMIRINLFYFSGINVPTDILLHLNQLLISIDLYILYETEFPKDKCKVEVYIDYL